MDTLMVILFQPVSPKMKAKNQTDHLVGVFSPSQCQGTCVHTIPTDKCEERTPDI